MNDRGLAVADPGFLKGGWLPGRYDWCPKQKSAEELPNMHASANWVSWQGTTGLLTALIEYLTVLLEYPELFQSKWWGKQAFGRAWVLPGPPLAMPLPSS